MNSPSSSKQPSPKSIDQWIDWLSQSRQTQPTQSLRSLLDDHQACVSSAAAAHESLPIDVLIELACIDLIQQLRQGHEVTADDFAEQFPELDDPECLLDLIDAELCVRRELNPNAELHDDLEHYKRKYSELADAIDELAQLSGDAPLPRLVTSVPPTDSALAASVNGSIDLSYDELPSQPSTSTHALSGQVLPIGTPDWFVGDQCIASSSDHWLVRGRDATSGETMALKVIKLHTQTSQAATDLILQACERASRVKNPHWVAPTVAAVQSGYLAIIRPWRFGTHWQDAVQDAVIPDRLRQFAQVAYTLQSAHQENAWHGALNSKNLIVDHQNKIHLVDAVGSTAGLTRWTNQLEGESTQPLPPRWMADGHDLLKLVLQDEVDAPGLWSKNLQTRLRTIIQERQHECFGFIGDEFNRLADQFLPESGVINPPRLPWRRRLAQWIAGTK
ncbi:MAG: hypothetical protein WBD20_00270 [Pirellulaceae bacterium]